MKERDPVLILVEDDEDDYTLIRAAFASVGLTQQIFWVKNGEELLKLLGRSDSGTRADIFSASAVIFLDLNMPRMDGRETLKRLKANEVLSRLPVVVMTTSCSEDDIALAYALGAASYILKPLSFHEFVALAAALKAYWIDLVKLAPLPEDIRLPNGVAMSAEPAI